MKISITGDDLKERQSETDRRTHSKGYDYASLFSPTSLPVTLPLQTKNPRESHDSHLSHQDNEDIASLMELKERLVPLLRYFQFMLDDQNIEPGQEEVGRAIFRACGWGHRSYSFRYFIADFGLWSKKQGVPKDEMAPSWALQLVLNLLFDQRESDYCIPAITEIRGRFQTLVCKVGYAP